MSNDPHDDRYLLVEEALTAWRPRSTDGRILGHPAWHDLDETGREEVFVETQKLREMEAALDPEGLSSTARAVLDRIKRGG